MAKRSANSNDQKGKEKQPQNAHPPAKKARFEQASTSKQTNQKQQQQPQPQPSKPNKNKKKNKQQQPQPATVVASPAAPLTFIVSAGSYERILYGLECQFIASDSTLERPKLQATPVFSFPAHLSSIRSVAASLLPSPATGSERKVGGKYLVSGGMDEVVKVWDLKRKKEVGTLDGDAPGTITSMKFVPNRNMLLVATTDCAITLYRVRDWVHLRTLKGHKGRVNAVDAHPAGRVALSVGQDKMLRMWDLVAGKSVATLKIGEEGDVVRWNTDGTKFATICNKTLTVYALDMSVIRTLTAPSRFHDVRFCYFPLDAEDPTQKEYLFVACEDGKTRIFDLSREEKEGAESEPVAVLVGHSNRVKMLDILEVAYPTTTPSSTLVLTSISTDGKINLYDLSSLPSSLGTGHEIEPIASHDTDGSRLTCVFAVGMVGGAKTKKASEDGEAAVESEEDESEEEDEKEGDEEEDGEEGEDEELEEDEDEFEGIGEFEDEED
ncbi:WD40 repeat-like protein [Meredithblackwellia eburnea MCA 4105]